MDDDRFDEFVRAANTRRGAVGLGLGGLLVLARGGSADVGDRRERRFRRRIKRRLRKLRRGPTAPQVTPEPSCAGSDGCGTDRCGPNDGCFCRIAAQNGTAFCGGSAYDVLNCGQCGAGTVCVNLSACGAVGCAPVCATTT